HHEKRRHAGPNAVQSHLLIYGQGTVAVRKLSIVGIVVITLSACSENRTCVSPQDIEQEADALIQHCLAGGDCLPETRLASERSGYEAPVDMDTMLACAESVRRVRTDSWDTGANTIYRCNVGERVGEFRVIFSNTRSKAWGCALTQYVFFSASEDPGE